MPSLTCSALPRPIRFLTFARSFAVLVALGATSLSPLAASALPIPVDCLPDSDGANDLSGAKDITQFCVEAGDNSPFELNTIINLDITSLNGANTAEVCELFDTDGDAFANLALCVTTRGNPLALQAVRLFNCDDSKADRCGGDALIVGPYSTQCEVTQQDTDPFPGPAPGPGDDYPTDTEILCGVDLADFGAAGAGAVLQDVCSYSSPNPNSASSDCISFAVCAVDADCDDGNVCTTDTCDVTGVCQFSPNPGLSCDDGQFCNGEEECTVFGLCGVGSGGPVDCDDGVNCTLDTCDELGDVCQNDPMNSLCSDGEFCTGVETCDPINDCQVGSPPNCSDGVACTVDACNEANDGCDNSPNDAACDDGTFCDGSEVCNETLGCQEGTPPSCDDGVSCTTDSCDDTSDQCENVASDAACGDGQFCNGTETCDETLGCQAGTAPDCADAFACTIDTCDEAGDVCAHSGDDSACGNGDFCDGEETCIVGIGCAVGIAPECGDGVSCTVDSCNEAIDQCDNVADNAACDNGAYCDGAETCDETLGCQDGPAIDCGDGVSCTTDFCDESTDSCDNTPVNAICDDEEFCNGEESCDVVNDCQPGTPPACTDAIACTIDTCDETNDICVYTPDNSVCGNADFCDGEETCIAGVGCAVGVAPDCSDGVGCTVDSCNEDLDRCDNVPDDAPCSDGDFCTGVEFCHLTLDCEPGTPPDCADGVGCTTDSCNEGADACDHLPVDAACDNGAFCDGDETCDVVNDCQDGTAPDCGDGVGCTVDSCNEATDECDNVPDNVPCSDGDFCTGVEICDPADDCEPGADPCPTLQCDEQADMCFGCIDDAECDDSVHCNGAEVCTLGVCGAGVAIDCDDGVSCTVDSCNEGTDSCDNPASNALCDDGDHCNGAETCDAVNDCQAGTAPDCDDGVSCTVDSCNEDTDSCDNDPDNAPCDDGTFCNGAETCNATTGCEAASPPDCDDGVSCTTDSCYEIGKVCINAPNNGACDNGDYCDGAETCDALNDCQTGTAPDCGDGVVCTIDACNEDTDSCDHPTSDAACDNGAYCDGAETCDAVNDCEPGTAPDCDDGVSCTQDSCNEGNDSCDNAPDDDDCSNGTFCDGAEVCDPMAGCQPAEPLTCDDGIVCTNDSCDEGASTCVNAPNNGACGDMQFCNGVEVCDAVEGCQPGLPTDCDDGVACSVDGCDEGADLCTHTADNALCGNGLFCDGVETCSLKSGGCAAGSPVACPDAFVCTTDSCDEDTDACEHDFGTCVCGDSEITGAEQCDPSAVAGTYEDCNDNIDNDADGKVDCRDQDCKPGARPDICDESCSLDQVCARFIRDPARIVYNTEFGTDEFYIHGRIPMTKAKLRAVVHAVTFELSNKNGPIYRASLDEGDLRGGIAGKRFRFRDADAPYLGTRSARGGLERVWVRTRRFEGVRYLVFTIRAYGDFSKARHRLMTSELSIGTEVGYLTAEWTANRKGWILHQKDFAAYPE